MKRIVCDIGGTKTRIAKGDKDGFDTPIVYDTPTNYTEALTALDTTFKMLGTTDVDSIVIGVPGVLFENKDSLYSAPNLPLWVSQPLRADIQKISGISHVRLQNDTALVGLGEAIAGAGRGYDIVAYLTVSTGVGGVRIVNKTIDVAHYGFEPGHHIIDVDGTADPKAFLASHTGVGHLDTFVSGKSMQEKYNTEPKLITEIAVWDSYAKALSIGVYNTLTFWSPDIVVLGGSMMVGNPAIPLDALGRYMADIQYTYPTTPDLVLAELADFGGLHGGFALE